MLARRIAQRGLTQTRFASTKTLKQTLQEVIPEKRARLQELRTKHGNVKLGDVTVDSAIGGMRGLKVLFWESSIVDPNEGIRFHGLSIKDCQGVLPAAAGGKEIIPESMVWLLLTGQVPTERQTRDFSRELAEKGELPDYAAKLIDALPRDMHPMTQLAIGVAALNKDSVFAAAYEKGIKKTEYWEPTLEDAITLMAKLPALAARIYRNAYFPGKELPALDANRDLVGNYANLLGVGDNQGLTEYLRLYIALHGDHEGGNVSAHTAHLVGSALSDPYLSYSAALLGLAGPLHGLANQEAARYVIGMQEALGNKPTQEQIKAYIWDTLNSGRVIPGYGHGTLRAPDPRFMAIQEFAAARDDLKDSPLVRLVLEMYNVAPGVLTEHGKSKNPNPNVDAISGSLLYHWGLTQFRYYTVIFGVSRVLAAVAQLVWARAFGLPIERPKSVTLDSLEKLTKSS
ncbi:citrate synthase-like protein [Auriculariales sp. MPI-PUGE-AT-0066]|nr:citrate synthase-like protein [Auriculariales sp. MPI-PUGE-AT-0066]